MTWGRWSAVAALGGGLIGGCVVYTDIIAAQFNSGLIDSPADPTRLPFDRKEAIVVALLREELMDAYFKQGEACARGWNAPLGTTSNVCVALDRASPLAGQDAFVEYVKCFAFEKDRTKCGVLKDTGPRLCGQGGNVHPAETPPDTATSPWDQVAPELKEKASVITDNWLCRLPDDAPVCKDGKLNDSVVGPFLDRVRFDLAIARAAEAVGHVLREGLVDEKAVEIGKQRAFHEAALYLKRRTWARSTAQRTLGLVAKGGSATGIYSAGAAWTILNLIQSCTENPASCGLPADAIPNLDFRIVSGTSTGTMVVTAVDRFNTACNERACDHRRRRRTIDEIARWFTCYSLNDLYCVDSNPILDLALEDDEPEERQLGVIKFDGIRDVLSRCITKEMLKNRSELVLNITDFRSGRLLHLSDQGELQSVRDVVDAAIASAALPFFVYPEPKMRVDVAGPHRREGTFLDGGIRSEIPLLALAKRGVERAVVISSSASVSSDTEPLTTSVAIALRYMDVATGGVSEAELAHAERHVESLRLSEYHACVETLNRRPAMCGAGCDPQALCEGRFHEVCGRPPPEPLDPKKPVPTPDQRIESSWQVERIFRNADEIDGAYGYNFDPTDLRRLFRAGAEAARQRCIPIAKILGIPHERAEIAGNLMRYCNARLAKPDKVCGTSTVRAAGERIPLRSCDEPLPLRCEPVCEGAPIPEDCTAP